jgi:hypothetical protein
MRENKFLKKLMAVAMSIAVIFSMSAVTSFAAQDDVVKGLTFTKVFENVNGGIVPNETFSFTMTPEEVEANTTGFNGLAVNKGIELKDSQVNIVYTSLSESEQSATFSFEGVDFGNKAALYRYRVQEVKPEVANKDITFDEEYYIVDLMVNNNGEVTSVMNVTNGVDTTVKKPIVFTNKYTSSDLVIRKKVSGSLGDKDEKFKFTLFIPGPGDGIDLEENASITAYIEDTVGSKEQKQIKVGENFEFELSDGEQLLVENVPTKMIYTVTEQGAQDYTTNITCTSVKGNGEADRILYNQKTYDASANDTPIVDGGENLVIFENIKDYKTDTGVRIDVVPYIVVFIIAIAGVSVLIFHRRRKWTK